MFWIRPHKTAPTPPTQWTLWTLWTERALRAPEPDPLPPTAGEQLGPCSTPSGSIGRFCRSKEGGGPGCFALLDRESLGSGPPWGFNESSINDSHRLSHQPQQTAPFFVAQFLKIPRPATRNTTLKPTPKVAKGIKLEQPDHIKHSKGEQVQSAGTVAECAQDCTRSLLGTDLASLQQL